MCRGTGFSFARLRRAAVTALAVAVASSCGTAEAVEDDTSTAVPGFESAAPSLYGLGEAILRAMVRGDEATLERYRLTEYEHNEVVWPELPASAPEVNFPVDYAWTNIENRNRRGLARIRSIYEGRGLGYQGMECRGGTEEFETFVVHTDCWILFVTDANSVEMWEAQVFKDVVERGGGYKIFRYYDEEPRRRGGA